MREFFPGHFRETQGAIKAAWQESLFIFDANVLLNLYRYSDRTRDEFLRILDKFKHRIWLPHRAAEEYLNNRLQIIGQQEQSYEASISDIRKLKEGFENSRKHPFVTTKVMKQAEKTFEMLCSELTANKKVHSERIIHDEIKEAVAGLFEKKIGEEYSKKTLEAIFVEGEERYKHKIPPGFKDGTKTSDDGPFHEKCRRFGDLIVWKQILDKAKEIDRGVIFITDDRKEDWWEQFKGKTIGPRPEMVQEFKAINKDTFLMYQPDRFLELAQESLGGKVSEEMVEEVREVQLARNKMREKERRYYRTKHRELVKQVERAKKKFTELEQDYQMAVGELNYYEEQQKDFFRILRNPDQQDEENSDSLLIYRTQLLAKIGEVKDELRRISNMRDNVITEIRSLQRELERQGFSSQPD